MQLQRCCDITIEICGDISIDDVNIAEIISHYILGKLIQTSNRDMWIFDLVPYCFVSIFNGNLDKWPARQTK